MEKYSIYIIVLAVFVVRLIFLQTSKKNEKEILANGGEEYGAANSKRMTILHIIFYFGSILEAVITKTKFDRCLFLNIFNDYVICSGTFVGRNMDGKAYDS